MSASVETSLSLSLLKLVVCLYTHQVRLINFAHALLYYTVQGKTSLEDLQPLIKEGFCTKEEARSGEGTVWVGGRGAPTYLPILRQTEQEMPHATRQNRTPRLQTSRHLAAYEGRPSSFCRAPAPPQSASQRQTA